MQAAAVPPAAPVAAPPPRTLPSELAKGPGLHCLVRIELVNGTALTGRITDMDPLTMNLKIDALSRVAVRRQFTRTVGSGDASSAEKGKTSTKPGANTRVAATRVAQAIHVDEEEVNPVALRCVNSVVVRGATIRYIDFISEEASGGRGLEDVVAVASSVTPS